MSNINLEQNKTSNYKKTFLNKAKNNHGELLLEDEKSTRVIKQNEIYLIKNKHLNGRKELKLIINSNEYEENYDKNIFNGLTDKILLKILIDLYEEKMIKILTNTRLHTNEDNKNNLEVKKLERIIYELKNSYRLLHGNYYEDNEKYE